MARKTKAELQAEHAVFLAQQLAEEVAVYPARLMAAMEDATTKNNYELEVRNGMFSLRDRDSSYRDTYTFTVSHTVNSFNSLEYLESDLRMKESERAEAARLSEVRRQAFLKLSKEEQTALGLNDRNNW